MPWSASLPSRRRASSLKRSSPPRRRSCWAVRLIGLRNCQCPIESVRSLTTEASAFIPSIAGTNRRPGNIPAGMRSRRFGARSKKHGGGAIRNRAGAASAWMSWGRSGRSRNAVRADGRSRTNDRRLVPPARGPRPVHQCGQESDSHSEAPFGTANNHGRLRARTLDAAREPCGRDRRAILAHAIRERPRV